MEDKIIVSKQEFALWKQQTITQLIFKNLEDLKKGMEEALLNTDFHLKTNDLERGRLLGQREGIELLLNVHVEDIEEEKSEEIEDAKE